ncbi:jg12523 [Pararge aegeria aegeria]|uniref:Jg12523 protein n=1 Tax=Pararge aegeria aegeria TaxID=348720 RepID=A0A8S4R4C1_9NEOP|nr:jg12523 [Pararge aegeria aegeria]
MELTSSPYKNEIENKNISKGKKLVLDINKIKTEKGINETLKLKNTDETCKKNKKIKAKGSCLCQLCKEDREENMIQCIKCKGWMHDQCAGVESKIKKYMCDICVQSQ